MKINNNAYVSINTIYNTLIKYYNWSNSPISKMILKNALASIPASEIISIIKCKQCSLWDQFPNCDLSTQFHACHKHIQTVGTTENDFCSYGIVNGENK